YNQSLDSCYEQAAEALKGAHNRLKRGKLPESVEEELIRISRKAREWEGAYHCSSAFCPADRMVRNKRKQELEAAEMPEIRKLKELCEVEMDYLSALMISHAEWKTILAAGLKATREAIAKRGGGAR
ncbi:MAG: hypothetical protein KDB07_02835, partial [Planctomycetes bacterium]|nr:hypothetical protein [Planctomycetota bacterium]